MVHGSFRNDLLAQDDETPHDERHERLGIRAPDVGTVAGFGTVMFRGRFDTARRADRKAIFAMPAFAFTGCRRMAWIVGAALCIVALYLVVTSMTSARVTQTSRAGCSPRTWPGSSSMTDQRLSLGGWAYVSLLAAEGRRRS